MGVISFVFCRQDHEVESLYDAYTRLEVLSTALGSEWNARVTPLFRNPQGRPRSAEWVQLDAAAWVMHFECHDIVDGVLDADVEEFPLCGFTVRLQGKTWIYEVNGQGDVHETKRIETCCNSIGFTNPSR
jgi:hypothetical protein